MYPLAYSGKIAHNLAIYNSLENVDLNFIFPHTFSVWLLKQKNITFWTLVKQKVKLPWKIADLWSALLFLGGGGRFLWTIILIWLTLDATITCNILNRELIVVLPVTHKQRRDKVISKQTWTCFSNSCCTRFCSSFSISHLMSFNAFVF